jgi:alkaline phosphatase
MHKHQMHLLDYERALGELLELDDTIKGAIAKLSALGILNDTLIIVTADHGKSLTIETLSVLLTKIRSRI